MAKSPRTVCILMTKHLHSDDQLIQSNQRTIGSLESARGLAALSVAAFHSGHSRWSNGDLLRDAYDREHPVYGPIGFFYSFLCNGHAAVVFFFVLSGFVLALSTNRYAELNLHWARDFLIRRVLRIYPAVIGCIAILCLFYAITGLTMSGLGRDAFRPWNVVSNALLLRMDLNGALWTMQLEMLAIPVIMLSVLLIRNGFISVVIIIAFAFFSCSFSNTMRNLMAIGDVPVGMLFGFVLGVLSCAFGKKITRSYSPKASRNACWISVFILLATRPLLLGWACKWCPIVEAFASAGFIVCCTFGPRTSIQNLLERPSLRFLGKISFSFYLLHPMSVLVMGNATSLIESLRLLGIPSFAIAIGLAAASSATIIPLAWLSWRCIENPCLRLSRHSRKLPSTNFSRYSIAIDR